MLILKLGGAAITNKVVPNTAQPEAIQAIASMIATTPQPMIIVHGAGSFGHILAKEYSLQQGWQTGNDAQRQAFVRLQQQLHRLNRLVVDALIEAGLPAVSIQPLAMTVMDSLRMTQTFIEPIRHILDLGMLPVLYGDCVFDTAQGFGILSGDQLVVHLANALDADRVAFGTNVAGVLDADGQVISRISAHTQITQYRQGTADVTGGMLGKLQEIAHLQHATAWIFELQNLDHLRRILRGEGAGTLIEG